MENTNRLLRPQDLTFEGVRAGRLAVPRKRGVRSPDAERHAGEVRVKPPKIHGSQAEESKRRGTL